MRQLITSIIFASLLALSASAQVADSTSVATMEKLDFEQPHFLIHDYFSSVNAHLSAEGKKAWTPEFSLRAIVMLFDGSVDLTGGIRTSQNKVFGVGVGWGQNFYWVGEGYGSIIGQRINIFAYHRHYIPLGHKKRVSLYSDIMLGGLCTYKLPDWYMENGIQRTSTSEPRWPILPGDLRWWISWEPGIAFHLWGKSNFFLGPSIGPTIGFHGGIAL